MLYHNQRGFTLIELLVVCAILGVLAVVASGYITKAKVRAEVAQVNADFRNLALALNTYELDQGKSVPTTYATFSLISGSRPNVGLYELTTPVSYMNYLPTSPWMKNPYRSDLKQELFISEGRRHLVNDTNPSDYFYQTIYNNYGDIKWHLVSYGPTLIRAGNIRYSPTNGVISVGKILVYSDKVK